MKNISDILRPGGEAILTYVVNAPMYPVQKAMATSEKWKKYIPNVEENLPPFLDSKDPISELRKLLCDTGFICQDLAIHAKVSVFSSKRTLESKQSNLSI